MVAYEVELADPRAHLFRVRVEVAEPALEQVVSLPVWIPGSYLVREFARHVVSIEARQRGERVEVEPLDKASWRARCGSAAPLRLS